MSAPDVLPGDLPASLGGLLLRRAAERPDAPALVAGDHRASYAEFRDGALRAAGLLRARGVCAGDRVAVLVGNRASWLHVTFGALLLGARVDALNTWAKAWDLRDLLPRTGARVLVTADRAGGNDLVAELGQVVPEAWNAAAGGWSAARAPALEHVLVDGTVVPTGGEPLADAVGAATPLREDELPEVDAAAVAFVLYTSGSTAAPKAVPLLHADAVANGFAIGARMRLGGEDRVWLGSPLFWSFGAANALLATLGHGACLVLDERFEPRASAELLARESCTAAYLLPTIADALANEARETVRRIASLRTGLTIGRPDEVQRAIEALDVPELCNVYGSTETYGNCCVTPCDTPAEERVRTQGPPLPGVELRVVDPGSGAPLAAGEVGELQVRGRITPGYEGDPEATAAAIDPDGWYRTGDHAMLDERGWLRFAARATDMIKTAGINVSPAEVERFLCSLPDVEEAVVVGAPHPARGEVVVAFVRPPAGAAPEPEDLRTAARAGVAGFKVPWEIVVLDALPVTDTGKVRRRDLVAEAQDRVADRLAREEALS